jgi:DNA-binding NtrC family response regulator
MTAAGGEHSLGVENEGGAYLGLLWNSEIELLRPLLRIALETNDRVIEAANHHCRTHFGEPRGVFRPDALRVFTTAMLEALKALLEAGPAEHSRHLIAAGERLYDQRVPFHDVVLAIYFYEEAILSVLPPLAIDNHKISRLFAKLSHIRLALLSQRHSHCGAAAPVQAESPPSAEPPGPAPASFHGIVGQSEPIKELCQRIAAAARVRGTLLLVGESGTGKELVARAIHAMSAESARPFVAVNCAAIPRDLIESEFFGYVRGAFSGAQAPSLGLFRSAHTGTLFLDEVTEMSPGTQSKVLRAIQERAVRPVGGTQEIPIDIRLIASTNRDPEQAVRAGVLRADLYYRLQASMVRVPPLRERLEDLPLLVEHFVRLWGSRRNGREPLIGIETEALQLISTYDWPGNVRELSNAVESAATFGSAPLIQVADLPETICSPKLPVQETPQSDSPPPSLFPQPAPPSVMSLNDSERELLTRALSISGRNKTRAAALLQISRKRLYFLMRKYCL